MRLLLYTNLYPDRDRPRHGIFVEERLRQLRGSGDVEASVCALRPGFTANPLRYLGFGAAATRTRRSGVDVAYQPVPTLPLVSNWVDPVLWARASRQSVARLRDELGPDAILDAHFLYPDGVAAVLLGRSLGMPVVLTARGSDVNVKGANPVMRRWIRWAAMRAAAVITVSADLAGKLAALGVPDAALHVLPNGVDLDRFRPVDGSDVRARYGLSGRVVTSVGNLVRGKGHHIAIEALSQIPGASLLVVGDGPERASLEALARKLGVGDRVRFAGLVAHDEIAAVYSASDVTVLASDNEGMPNVVLESIACGTRVVATNVGGIGEVVTEARAGRLVDERNAGALAHALREVLDEPCATNDTRDFAGRLGWRDTVRGQLALYEQVALT